MNFIIKDQDYPYQMELENIFRLFKEEDDKLIFSDTETEGFIVDLKLQVDDEHIEALAKTIINGEQIVFKNKRKSVKEEQYKIAKKAIIFVWLQILESIYKRRHDWGILTGIRPTKLYHKLLLQTKSHQKVFESLTKDYLVKKEKVELLQDIVNRQLKVIPDLYEIDKEVSIYIGIPFCPTKCAYCTFPAYAINGKHSDVDGFLEELYGEIDAIGSWLQEKKRRVTTIYFGGGTPTSISAEQMDQIFLHLAKGLDLKTVREITVEAGRPDTITMDKIDILKKWNVDRISINPQSFTQDTLDIIGRHHTVKETIEKYSLAKENGVDNINMDLIIGLPGEGLEQIEDSLKHIDRLQPNSLTIHTMAFKRASYLTKNKEEFEITEPEEVKKMMEYATRWTKEHDYFPYYLYRQKNMLGNLENIGYSKEGSESLYNILIMEEKQTIIGIGSGAASKLIIPGSDKVSRFPNPKDPSQYIETIAELTEKKIKKLNQIFAI